MSIAVRGVSVRQKQASAAPVGLPSLLVRSPFAATPFYSNQNKQTRARVSRTFFFFYPRNTPDKGTYTRLQVELLKLVASELDADLARNVAKRAVAGADAIAIGDLYLLLRRSSGHLLLLISLRREEKKTRRVLSVMERARN
jgi:hypothetical protein